MERLLRVASPLGPLRRGVRHEHRPPPGQLPAGLLPPGADRGRRADHPRRAAPQRSSMMEHYDVIVIGSGAGGGTLAHRLAPSGKRILLLERGDWLPREPQNWLAGEVFEDGRYVSPDSWYDGRRQALPAAGPLLRRRRDQALRRGAVPLPRRGLRRAAPPRRHLAGVADLLRGDGALLHAGRAALPGARRARRGPHRTARRARPIRTRPSRTSRASQQLSDDFAATGHAPVPRALRGDARRVATCPTARASAARTATASRAWCTPSPTPR